MSKIYGILGIVAIAILLLGYGTGAGWWIAALATALILLHVFKIYHADGTEKKPTGSVLSLVVIGLLVLTGFSLNLASLPQTMTVPQASVISDDIATGSGQFYTGEFNFIPKNAGGGAYASAGRVTITDLAGKRYDLMEIVTDKGGEPAITYKGNPSIWYTQSSNKFAETQFSGRPGDRFNLFGYVDTSPANRENVSFVKTVVLDSFNPQSGTNGGIWNWHFEDTNSNTYQWNMYPLMDWMDSANVLRNGYRDVQSAATSGQQKVIYIGPQSAGEQVMDLNIYVDSPTGTIGNLNKITVETPTGKKVESTNFVPVTDIATNDPKRKAAPATNTSITSSAVHYALTVPFDGTWRTGNTSSTRNIYKVTLDYDHPATAADWIFALHATENSGALSDTGGHYDIADDFVMNVTANTDFSTGDI